jgi:vitamin B12 transporter
MLFYLPSLISPGNTGGLQMFKKNSLSKRLLLSLFVLFSASFIIHGQEIQQPEKNVPQSEDQKIQKKVDNIPEKISKKKFKSDGIIITATKNEIDKKETGASVSIITGEEIAESGKDMAVDLLTTIPGIDVVKTGTFGGIASIGIRGTNQKNVLILIDGVPVNDPIGGGGDKFFNFANLSTDNIERIEIIRGPSSVLYGSESAAGVINIITKMGKGKPEVRLSVEGGSFLTFKETASFTASNDLINFSLAASRIDSEGMSKRANPDGSITGLENDPYHNTSISSRTRLNLFGNSSLDFNIHYINSEIAVDDFTGDSPYHMFYSEFFSTGLIFNQTLSFWNHRFSFGHSSSKTKDINEPPAGFDHTYFDGMNEKVEWQNNFNINTENIKDTISIGVSGSFDTASLLTASNTFGFDASRIPEKSVSIFGLYLQNHFKLFDRLFLITGGRYDYNQNYGSDLNYNISLSGIIPVIETRIKGNAGTGFKSPTLYQLYIKNSWITGNTSLSPEKNFSFDIGFEQPLFNNLIVINAVYFNSVYTNLITTIETSPWVYKFINLDKAYMQGFELDFTFNLPYNIKLTAGYTFTKANAAGSDAQLARRPMDKFFSVFNWSFLNRGNINISYTYIGTRRDSNYSNIMLSPYVKLDLAVSFWIIDSVQIFVKIDNVTDSRYQEANGYAMPGINGYGGVTVKL